MSLVDEKRKGADRRLTNDGPPRGKSERRGVSEERRQVDMTEISFFEWASQFAKYQGRAVSEASAVKTAHADEVLGRARS